MINPIRIGFLGSGSIAQAHAYALDALKYYYADSPPILKVAVASPTPAHREAFAERFGFQDSITSEALLTREDLDAVYILGANATHTPQLLAALSNPTFNRIYVEKPIAISSHELYTLETLERTPPNAFIMMGFQYLQKAPIRKALEQWRTGDFGTLVHFNSEYLHSSYLDPAKLAKASERLAPIPRNGAAVDLGSHALSLLTAFLGNHLVVHHVQATAGGLDVPSNSDLCTIALLEETTSGAIGTMTASRISAGTGDQLSLELRGTKGAIIYDTHQPDSYQSYLPELGWQKHNVYSDYLPDSKFLSHYMPAGWLRAMVHNHYLFLGGDPGIGVIPGLAHGIQVQRLLQQIADHLITD